MKKISTPHMASVKPYPLASLACMVLLFFLMLVTGIGQAHPMFLVVPCVMGVIGYFHGKSVQRNLVDEVYDYGDSLRIRKGREEDTIPLSNIMNVNFNTPPARITLTLAVPGKFGSEIAFVPPPKIYFGAVPEDEVATDLLTRVIASRGSSKSFAKSSSA